MDYYNPLITGVIDPNLFQPGATLLPTGCELPANPVRGLASSRVRRSYQPDSTLLPTGCGNFSNQVRLRRKPHPRLPGSGCPPNFQPDAIFPLSHRLQGREFPTGCDIFFQPDTTCSFQPGAIHFAANSWRVHEPRALKARSSQPGSNLVAFQRGQKSVTSETSAARAPAR